MKRFWYTLLFLLPLHWLAGQSAFSVREAIDYARERSAPVQNSRLDQQRSTLEAERLQRTWLPRVSANANLRYNPILQTTLLPAEITGGPGGELVEVQFGTPFSGAMGLKVDQKVLDPVFKLERERLSLDREGAALDEAYEAGLLELRVLTAYYGALLRREALANSRGLLGSLDTLRRDVRVRVENELEDPALLNTLNQQYRRQQNRILLDSLDWRSELAALKLEMNFPAGTELRLTDSLGMDFDIPSGLTLDDAYQVRQYDLQLRTSQNSLEQLKRSDLPSLQAEGYLGGQFFSDAPDLYNLNQWYGQSYLGLTAVWPLYDGNDRRYGEQIEQLRMEQVRNRRQAYRNEQENRFAHARLELESARAQAQLARQAIATAEENLALARTNYRNELTGFRPVFDALQEVVNGRGQLIEARVRYVQAVIDARRLGL